MQVSTPLFPLFPWIMAGRLEGCSQAALDHVAALTQLTSLELLAVPPVARVPSLTALTTLTNLEQFSLQCHGDPAATFSMLTALSGLTRLRLIASHTWSHLARGLDASRMQQLAQLQRLKHLELCSFLPLSGNDLRLLAEGCPLLEHLVVRVLSMGPTSMLCADDTPYHFIGRQTVFPRLKTLLCGGLEMYVSMKVVFPVLERLWQCGLGPDGTEVGPEIEAPAEVFVKRGVIYLPGLLGHPTLRELRIRADVELQYGGMGPEPMPVSGFSMQRLGTDGGGSSGQQQTQQQQHAQQLQPPQQQQPQHGQHWNFEDAIAAIDAGAAAAAAGGGPGNHFLPGGLAGVFQGLQQFHQGIADALFGGVPPPNEGDDDVSSNDDSDGDDDGPGAVLGQHLAAGLGQLLGMQQFGQPLPGGQQQQGGGGNGGAGGAMGGPAGGAGVQQGGQGAAAGAAAGPLLPVPAAGGGGGAAAAGGGGAGGGAVAAGGAAQGAGAGLPLPSQPLPAVAAAAVGEAGEHAPPAAAGAMGAASAGQAAPGRKTRGRSKRAAAAPADEDEAGPSSCRALRGRKRARAEAQGREGACGEGGAWKKTAAAAASGVGGSGRGGGAEDDGEETDEVGGGYKRRLRRRMEKKGTDEEQDGEKRGSCAGGKARGRKEGVKKGGKMALEKVKALKGGGGGRARNGRSRGGEGGYGAKGGRKGKRSNAAAAAGGAVADALAPPAVQGPWLPATLLEALGSLPQLRTLMLESCGQLKMQDWQQLVAASKLRSLAVHGASQMTNEGLQVIGTELQQLEQLNLGGAPNVTDYALNWVTMMRNIERVSFSRCRQLTPVGMEIVALNPNVMHIRVADCEKCYGDSAMEQFEEIIMKHGGRGLMLVVMAAS